MLSTNLTLMSCCFQQCLILIYSQLILTLEMRPPVVLFSREARYKLATTQSWVSLSRVAALVECSDLWEMEPPRVAGQAVSRSGRRFQRGCRSRAGVLVLVAAAGL